MMDSAKKNKSDTTDEKDFDGYRKERRTIEMLTVQKLIDYLKTCNPSARVLGFEPNSNAYIEQFPELPNRSICTVSEDKKHELEFLGRWFKDCEDAEEKINNEMDEIYRYSNDDDVIISL